MRTGLVGVLVAGCALPDEPRTGQDVCDDVAAAACIWAERCDRDFDDLGYDACVTEETVRCCVVNVDCDKRVKRLERDEVDDYWRCLGRAETTACSTEPQLDCDGSGDLRATGE